MRRLSMVLTILIGLGLIGAACAGPSSSTGQSSGGEPSTAPAGSEPAQSQAAPSEPSLASQAPASQGGSAGEPPAPPDGPWTGGRGQVTVSGAVQHSTDEPLTADRSETFNGGTSLLVYNSDDAFVTFYINSTGTPFHASVGTHEFDASGSECDVTYTRAEDNAIEATFSCIVDEFHFYGGDEPTGEIIISGTISATR
jgi:hypothetical protein